MSLFDRLRQRTATVGVLGLGYVGLPLAVEFAQAGFRTLGIEVDKERVRALQAGRSYIPDVPDETLAPLLESGRLAVTTEENALRDLDAVSICVPTPLGKTKDPDISYILAAVDALVSIAHPEQLIVLESTTYPGTTEEILVPRLAARGFVIGRDLYVAYSPERIDPGNRRWTLRTAPKLIGGVTPRCLEAARLLYEPVVETLVPVSSPRVAEMAKLLENTFRTVNIALVNEVTLMCHQLGLDVWEVIAAAATKPFGFMPFYPGQGLGGHCLPVDPEYLSWRLKTLNYHARFIQLAAEVNAGMPAYVLGRLADAPHPRPDPAPPGQGRPGELPRPLHPGAGPARQIGWMSRHGERLQLPLEGDGEVACPATGDRYQLKNGIVTCLES